MFEKIWSGKSHDYRMLIVFKTSIGETKQRFHYVDSTPDMVIDQTCSVMLAGYWSSYFCCMFMDQGRVEVHTWAKKERGQYLARSLDRTSLVNRGFITWDKEHFFFLRNTAGNLEREIWRSWGANHSSANQITAQYVWVIDQVWGQDGWILAKFFFCALMDRLGARLGSSCPLAELAI